MSRLFSSYDTAPIATRLTDGRSTCATKATLRVWLSPRRRRASCPCSAACFCDSAVVGKLNARNATFFRTLTDFTPMACGFAVKTGEVCP